MEANKPQPESTQLSMLDNSSEECIHTYGLGGSKLHCHFQMTEEANAREIGEEEWGRKFKATKEIGVHSPSSHGITGIVVGGCWAT